jgi:hypothetical protein
MQPIEYTEVLEGKFMMSNGDGRRIWFNIQINAVDQLLNTYETFAEIEGTYADVRGLDDCIDDLNNLREHLELASGMVEDWPERVL